MMTDWHKYPPIYTSLRMFAFVLCGPKRVSPRIGLHSSRTCSIADSNSWNRDFITVYHIGAVALEQSGDIGTSIWMPGTSLASSYDKLERAAGAGVLKFSIQRADEYKVEDYVLPRCSAVELFNLGL